MNKDYVNIKFKADDMSETGLCSLCWNLLARTMSIQVERNYEKNPYKDIPITHKHPIVADVAEDVYLRILGLVTNGATDPKTTVDLIEFLRINLVSCHEILTHPEAEWFEHVDDKNDNEEMS